MHALMASVLLFVLSGCGQESEPAPTPTPSPPVAGESDPSGTDQPPPGPTPTPTPEPAPAPPPVTLDLAGAPPYAAAPPACTPSAETHVLRGSELTSALRTLARGEPPAGRNHVSFAGSCEVPGAEVAQAYYDGGRELHRRGKHQLATTFYTQALRADPSHVWARYQLACALALTGRSGAAIGHLAELARSEAGRARLRETAPRDSDLDAIRAEPAFLSLMFPRTDLAGTAAPLAAGGLEHDITGLAPPDPTSGQRREAIEFPCTPRPRCEWPQFNQLLSATEPISGGTRRAYNRSELDVHALAERVPATVRAEGFEGLWGHYFYWHPADGVTYLVVSYTLLGGNARPHGYALYERSAEGKARLVHHFETGHATCAPPGDVPLELFFATDGFKEIREISGCGAEAAFNRVVHEDGALRIRRGRLQLAIDPQAPTAPPPEPAPPAPVPEVAGAPAFGPPPTCEPQTGEVIAGRTLQDHLRAIERGQLPDGIGVEQLLASCTVEPADVAAAFAEGAMARYHADDREGFGTFNRMGLLADRSNLRSRYNYACSLSLAGRADDALLVLRELARGGPAAARWFFWSLADSDLRNVRADREYWTLLDTLRNPPVRLHDRYLLTVEELPPGPDVIPAAGLVPPAPGGERLVRAEAPWRVFNDLLNQVMTERTYDPFDAGSVQTVDVPASVRRRGVRNLATPQWWRPVEGTTVLLVPYYHPESYFNAVAFFTPAEGGGLRYLGRDRARDNDCYDGGFALVAVTTEADEVRLAAGCEHSGYLNRYRQEGGAFRRILASLRPPDTREE